MSPAHLAGALRGASKFPGQAVALVALAVAFQAWLPAWILRAMDTPLAFGAIHAVSGWTLMAVAWGTWWAHARTVVDAAEGVSRIGRAAARHGITLAVVALLATPLGVAPVALSSLAAVPGILAMGTLSAFASRPAHARSVAARATQRPSLAARLRQLETRSSIPMAALGALRAN